MLAVALSTVIAGNAVAAPTTTRGVLQRSIGDEFSAGRTTERFSLRTAGGNRRLRDAQPRHLVGRVVEVTGESTSTGVAGTADATTTQPVTAPTATGPRTMAVVRITFPDNRTMPFTEAQIRERFFDNTTDSLNAFYRQQTNGATWFTGIRSASGDIFSWDSSATIGDCDIDLIDNAGRAAARAAGVNLAAYDHIVYVTPRRSCVGGTPEGVAYMPGTVSWLNANIATWVTAHEIGHNLGSSHAGSMQCRDANGQRTPLSVNCSYREYADPHSVMGNSPTVRLTDTWHRHQNGELTADEVRVAPVSDTYAVRDANDFVSTGPKLVLVPRVDATGAVDGYLAVEARRPTARYDTYAPSDPMVTGVTVRHVPAPRSIRNSYLLDMNPLTDSLGDAALQPGASFTDAETGVRITNTSTGSGPAQIAVRLPAGIDVTPPSDPQPQDFSVTVRTLRVTWGAATDDLWVSHYELERQGTGTILTTTSRTATVDIPTSVGGAYYRVVAVDGAGNRSSGGWTHVQPTPDVTPPTAPGGPFVTVVDRTVGLSWTASSDDDRVARYEVVRDGVMITTTTALRTTDVIPAGASRVTYRVVAVDRGGNRTPSTDVDVSPEQTATAVPPPPTTTDTPATVVPTTDTATGATVVPVVPATTGPSAPPVAPATPVATVTPTIAVLIPRLVAGRARLATTGRLRLRAPGATRTTLIAGGRVLATRAGAILDVRLPRRITRSRTNLVLTARARVGGRDVTRRIVVRSGRVTALRPTVR